ncbi:MAG: hypothetical protein SGPRY_004664 [Prymnesium sp.]
MALGEQTTSLLRQQDEELGQLGSGVKRVKALAGLMRDELVEQEGMLERLDDEVERTDGSMKRMSTRMNGLLEEAQKSDKIMYTTIVLLSLLLIFLINQVLS